MKIRTAAVLAAAALVAAGCTSTSPEGDASPSPSETLEPTQPADIDPDDPLAAFLTQEIDWEECEGDFECGTLTVPLDYDDTDGETLELALLRVPSESDDVIGSLVVNPGGPGGSGVDYAQDAELQISQAVRDYFDVVGFDPRGVARSNPIDCLDDAELDEFVATDAVPDDDAELAELSEHIGDFSAGCEQRSGDLLRFVNTENVARDLDVLRAALGDDVLYYLGKSYGTYIGALYADLFPERVGRLVLDGAVDPSLTSVEFVQGQARGVQRALDGYVADCVAGGECPLGETESAALETVTQLLEVIEDDPLPTDDPDRSLTQALAMYGIILPLYLPPADGYDVLTGALREALAGNGEVLRFLADIYLRRNDDGTYNGNQNEAIYAVHCVDKPSIDDPEQIEDIAAEFAKESPIFGPFLAWSELACADWPVPPVDEPGAVTAAGADPILVVGTTGDLATPYEWAEGLASQLESGELLTFEGFGHTAYFSGNDCIDDVVDTYLIDGDLPDEDQLRCS